MELDPSKTAFLFPGQGSQTIGMGLALTETYPVARATFALSDTVLGIPLSNLAWEGPEKRLNDTVNTQPALMVHSVAALRIFQEKFPDFQPAYIAGHSMGELSALVASGSMFFPDALKLVRIRGELMKEAGEKHPGGMAAILGLDIPTIEEICEKASSESEIVQVANDNCPGQVVVSGAGPALRRLLPIAKDAGARRIVPLMVSIAAHSPLMEAAQHEFNGAVEEAPIVAAHVPIVGNVSAKPLTRIRDIENDLMAQLTSRVRWTESIQFILSQGVTTFLEFGPGSVLCGLVRRIDRNTTGIPLGTPDDFEAITT